MCSGAPPLRSRLPTALREAVASPKRSWRQCARSRSSSQRRPPRPDSTPAFRKHASRPNHPQHTHSSGPRPQHRAGNYDSTSGCCVAPNSVPPLFSQTTASSTFRHGDFAGETVGDVAAAVRGGKIGAADLPVDVVVRNGETLALNTRSSLALWRGGIDPADWVLNDVTGNPLMEQILTERLLRNQIDGGVDVLRITGAGSNASNIG